MVASASSWTDSTTCPDRELPPRFESLSVRQLVVLAFVIGEGRAASALPDPAGTRGALRRAIARREAAP